jgi:vacuolar-type H+-ATPase subunit H
MRVVNASELIQLLERMRISVPGSIMESERTLAERDRILAEASAEAERLVQQARQRAVEMLSDNALVITARQEAERVAEEGRQMALRRAEEADHYTVHVLEELGQKLQVITKQVDNGIRLMQNKNSNTQPANPKEIDS